MRQNEEFVCPVCQKKLNNLRSVVNHIRSHKDYTQQSYYDKFFKKEGEGLCKLCNQPTKFYGFQKGYAEFCSHSCCNKYINQNPSVRKKIKDTLERRYGSRNYVNVDGIKNTKKKKYGYEYFPKEVSPLSPEKESARVQKILLTKEKRYGKKGYCNIEQIKETKRIRYGLEEYNNSEQIKETWSKKSLDEKKEIKNKALISKRKRIANNLEKIIRSNNLSINLVEVWSNKYKFVCKDCGNEFEIMPQLFRKRCKENRIICTQCNPLYNNQISFDEKELLKFIKSIYSGEILINDKSIISPYELDIYLPDLKLAFEYNGLYWHSELYKDMNYHLNKTVACEKNHIHLIHIYEDDWIMKNEIVRSRIKNLFHCSDQTIYARKCEVQTVLGKEARKFLKENHLQGYAPAKINLGLFYNNEMVSLMTFTTLRKNLGNKLTTDKWEMLRFCNKINTTVVGGASKILSSFIKIKNPKIIVSYADRSWTYIENNLYKSIGMKFDLSTKPGYWYIVDGVKENRFKYRKDVLVSKGFGVNKTEKQIMFEIGMYRIYNSGNLKYIWNSV